MARDCTIISWDSKQRVFGLTLKKGRDITVVSAAECVDSDIDFSSRLYKVFQSLKKKESGRVVVSGSFSSLLCFELSVPAVPLSELSSLIRYELPQLVPCSVDAVVWGYRVIPKKSSKEHHHIRVMVVRDHEWNSMQTALNAAGIKVDAVITPFFGLDPVLEDMDVYLIDIDPFYSFSNCNVCREMTPVTRENIEEPMKKLATYIASRYKSNKMKNISNYIPALISGEYVLSSSFANDCSSFVRVTVDLVIKRLRFLKGMAYLLFTCAVLLTLVFAGRNYIGLFANAQIISSELDDVEQLLKKMELERKENEHVDSIIVKLQESDAGINQLPIILDYIATKLPKTMWLTNFSLSGKKIDLTILSEKEDTKSVMALSRKGVFKLSNLRKRRNRDGSVSMTVSLVVGFPELIQPEGALR